MSLRDKLLKILAKNPILDVADFCETYNVPLQSLYSAVHGLRVKGFRVDNQNGKLIYHGVRSDSVYYALAKRLRKKEMTANEIKNTFVELGGEKTLTKIQIIKDLPYVCVLRKQVQDSVVFYRAVALLPTYDTCDKIDQLEAEFERTRPARVPFGNPSVQLARESKAICEQMKKYGLR